MVLFGFTVVKLFVVDMANVQQIYRIVAFFILGYLGMQAPTPVFTIISQICTIIYFLFFLLMPWYSRIDKCKPEPERVTQ